MGNRNKAELRQRCRQIREGLSPAEIKTSSEAVCAHLIGWHSLQQADTALSYIAFRNEIDLGRLFVHWPEKRWLAPRIVDGAELAPGQKPYLVPIRYDPHRLVRHRFGMLEPEPCLQVVDPSEVQIVLVPGVAFDRRGGRLGFGGGFYDRLLPQADRAIRVGVTHAQLVLDAIPMGPWDCCVDWLVTPDGLTRTDYRR